MPLYKAKCVKCGRVYDDIFATKPLERIVQKCVCGSTDFVKLPTAPGAVTFKGNGWQTPKPSGPAED